MTHGDRDYSGRTRPARSAAVRWADEDWALTHAEPQWRSRDGGRREFATPSSQWPEYPEHLARGGPPPRRRGEIARSTLWEGGVDGPQPLRARWDPIPPLQVRPPRRQLRDNRRRSSLGWFVHHYGWRAWALPVLTALTVLAVVGLVRSPVSDIVSPALPAPLLPSRVVTPPADLGDTADSVPDPGATAPPEHVIDDTDAPPTSTAAETPDAPVTAIAAAAVASELPPVPDIPDAFKGVAMGALPPGADFAERGAGTYHVVKGTSEPFGDGPDHRTFTIEVEDGISTPEADEAFAADVMEVLSDERSWIGTGDFTLTRVDSGTPDFRVTLASQITVRSGDNCGWDVQLEASCYNRLPGRVFINDARWVRGAFSFAGDLASYRVYAINHEVGHALGFGHVGCAATGEPAPIMMPQSWSTANDDIARLSPEGPVVADRLVCRANPFVD